MSLKVLQLTSSFPNNINSARYLYLWHSLEALQQAGVNPILLHTPSWKPFSPQSIDRSQFPIEIETQYCLSIPRHYFRNISNASYCASIVPRIKKLHQLYQFDVIHAHGEISGLAAVRAARVLSIPAVVTMHGVDMCPRMWKGDALSMFKKMFNQVDKLIFVGESLQRHFDPMLADKTRSCVVYNGVQLPKGININNAAIQSPFQIISISNLHEEKGINITLQALAHLKNQGICDWTYTIIGSGDQKNVLTEMVKKFNLQQHVEFKGDLTHDAVYKHLEKADIFCLPSYREAFGIVYLEAMLHGLLAIGVREQGPQAFIEHDTTGLLVEPKNIDSLTHTLLYALRNREKMRVIAEAGKKQVLENFTWKKHAEKLMNIYEEVSNRNSNKMS